MKSTVVDESLSSYKPNVLFQRNTQASTRLIQQYEKSTLKEVLVLDTSLLWWESMEVLVVSSCPKAAFISLCCQSTSSDRAPGSVLGLVPDNGVEGVLPTHWSVQCRRWGW